jgi:SMC interacting uncharacterized protein involved in chromosome segregation
MPEEKPTKNNSNQEKVRPIGIRTRTRASRKKRDIEDVDDPGINQFFPCSNAEIKRIQNNEILLQAEISELKRKIYSLEQNLSLILERVNEIWKEHEIQKIEMERQVEYLFNPPLSLTELFTPWTK